MFLFSVSFVVKQKVKGIVCVEPFQNSIRRLLLVLIWYIDSIFQHVLTPHLKEDRQFTGCDT